MGIKKKGNAKVATVFVVLGVIVGLVTFIAFTQGGGGKKAHAAAAASTTPSAAGLRFARTFNSTPPVTTQIMGMGPCQAAKTAGQYACVYLVQQKNGTQACVAILFQASPARGISAQKADNRYCGGKG